MVTAKMGNVMRWCRPYDAG